ncbi:MAG: DUF4349 domain-containing protein [Nanoarchaeota archaeon]|nr:DUF4349 domain-containing protein [Nanoarchaeota archaeon]
MGISDQFNTIKNNWLLIVLVFVLFIFMSGAGQVMSGGMYSMNKMAGVSAMDRSYGYSESSGYYAPSSGGFAPEVTERIKTKSSNLGVEVARGQYDDAATKLRAIVSASGSYLLNENENTYDTSWKAYTRGSFSIKIPTSKYDSVLPQLKALGEVKSFSENSDDVTGTYTDLNTRLSAEKEKLRRYNQMYDATGSVTEKLTLTDRIFSQEQTISYLENAVENIDNRVDYSQVSLSISEKQSEYADVIFAKFSDLVKTLVLSLNMMAYAAFFLLPWIVGYVIVRMVWKLVKR